MKPQSRILVIQTAFLGDVILATSFLKVLKSIFPESEIHFVVRHDTAIALEGQRSLIDELWVWDKRGGRKYLRLFQLGQKLKSYNFDYSFNLHRFFSSGFLSFLSSARWKSGFRQNPLSFCYDYQVEHQLPELNRPGTVNEEAVHEVDRNLKLLRPLISEDFFKTFQRTRPFIDTSSATLPGDLSDIIQSVKQDSSQLFVCAPASVWKTKAWPIENWIELAKSLARAGSVVFVGGPGDHDLCEKIFQRANLKTGLHRNLAGKVSVVQTALLMSLSKRVFCNDSAPLHMASAVNAPTTAFFCSTVPEFGYFPLSNDSRVIQVESLLCRPCGIHGMKSCPLSHFDCGKTLSKTLSSL